MSPFYSFYTMQQAQVGKLSLNIHLSRPYLWSEKFLRFLNVWDNPGLEVEVYLDFVEELPSLSSLPLYSSDGVAVYKEGEGEVRTYKALFVAGHPLYAISYQQGNTVKILFRNLPHEWNHPNMLLFTLVHLEDYLLQTAGLIFHSCYAQYRGKAILFTAPSGTGKTTHAQIWQRVYGLQIVNGDKSVLQQEDSGWYAYGFPLSGSAPECKNRNYPIQAIVIIRQSPVNYVEEIRPSQKVALLYDECTVNAWKPESIGRAMDLLIDLISKVPVYVLHCNMEDEAAQVLHEKLYGTR